MTYCCKPVLRILLKIFFFSQRINYVTRNSDHLRHYAASVTFTMEFNCKKYKYPDYIEKKNKENDKKKRSLSNC